MPAVLPRRALVARIVTLRRVTEELARQAAFDGCGPLDCAALVEFELDVLVARLAFMDGEGRAA